MQEQPRVPDLVGDDAARMFPRQTVQNVDEADCPAAILPLAFLGQPQQTASEVSVLAAFLVKFGSAHQLGLNLGMADVQSDASEIGPDFAQERRAFRVASDGATGAHRAHCAPVRCLVSAVGGPTADHTVAAVAMGALRLARGANDILPGIGVVAPLNGPRAGRAHDPDCHAADSSGLSHALQLDSK